MSGREILAIAADCIDGRQLSHEDKALGRSLLSELGASALEDVEERCDLSHLLRVAAGLNRIFQLNSPDMPGLCFFGAEADPQKFGSKWGHPRGVSGVGVTPLDAFRRCVGEAVEYLSQHIYDSSVATWGHRKGDAKPTDPLNCLLALSDPPTPTDRSTDWCDAYIAATKRRITIPVDFCWRRHPEERAFKPRFAPGLGCAAGRTRHAATLSAIQEVIERDALALWWRGGQRARPVASDRIEGSGVLDLLQRARGGRAHRQTRFLDITTDVGVPVVAAVSFLGNDRGFAFGLSAAISIDDALGSACLELGQVELADHVVRAKIAESGEQALNETDRMHLRRSSEVCGDWPILHPLGLPARDGEDFGGDKPFQRPTDKDAVAMLARRLADHGHDVVLMDQTNEKFRVPVVRAIIPTLQPEPATIETPRLQETRSQAGPETKADRPPII